MLFKKEFGTFFDLEKTDKTNSETKNLKIWINKCTIYDEYPYRYDKP